MDTGPADLLGKMVREDLHCDYITGWEFNPSERRVATSHFSNQQNLTTWIMSKSVILQNSHAFKSADWLIFENVSLSSGRELFLPGCPVWKMRNWFSAWLKCCPPCSEDPWDWGEVWVLLHPQRPTADVSPSASPHGTGSRCCTWTLWRIQT